MQSAGQEPHHARLMSNPACALRLWVMGQYPIRRSVPGTRLTHFYAAKLVLVGVRGTRLLARTKGRMTLFLAARECRERLPECRIAVGAVQCNRFLV